jgi:SNF2 family DNA or RNA helicase
MSRFSNLEFHRSGIGLLTDPRESDPGSAMYLENAVGSSRPLRFCGCSVGRRRACRHLVELGEQIKLYRKRYHNRPWGDVFAATRWHRLAQLLFEGDAQPFAEVLLAQVTRADQVIVRLTSPDGRVQLELLEHSPSTLRFLERTAKVPPKDGFLDRSGLIDKLAIFLRTSEEQHLNRAGLKTNRQSIEESLWYRLAYHAFREYEEKGQFEASIDQTSGAFTLTFLRDRKHPVFRILVPRSRVRGVLAMLREEHGDAPKAPPQPLPLLPLLRLFADDPARRHLVGELQELIDPDDEAATGSPEVEKYRYGNVLYIPEAEILASLDEDEEDSPVNKRLLRSNRVPTYLEPVAEAKASFKEVLDDPIRELRILREFDAVEIATDGDDDEMAVRYRFGDQSIDLEDLVEARGRGLPYLESEQGWIDLSAPDLAGLAPLASDRRRRSKGGRRMQLSSAQILRLKSTTAKPVEITGSGGRAAIIERLLDMRPSQSLPELEGLDSALRPYQCIGVEWLHFLWENQLAGLLCDDMGLGKTHQAMALMILLREHHEVDAPFLVVCPRTVISHWRNKLRDHAPGLHPVVYHGPQRDLEAALEEGNLLIASYGVLRNDAKKLRKLSWGLVVFDEVQQIKNAETQAYKAGHSLPAQMKIGLTGTPIENSLAELKNLFDLVLPGYMGEDDDYFDRFGMGIRDEPDEAAIAALRRLVSPFVLRRLKETVLDELPEKIEDLRTCTLSSEQRDLYRRTINTRGAVLADKIRDGQEPLPYIHIFAVLNLLKQICDHPALALGVPEDWKQHDSRKWDLFQELLDESLGSGQKVVVFTQYLGMIRIMEQYLDELKVGYATLTGSTRKRGAVVDRFNETPDCRVFLGSLRAGGTGIDLIGGSVVIHYDRWWNAAKEDQATDRVYRIGQKRAVQVFKLLAEDTLEERIAIMIDRKRQLLGDVVQADHPRLGKIFTREELLDLLQQIE